MLIGVAWAELSRGQSAAGNLWIFLLANFSGGILAALAFRAINPNE